MRRCFINPSPSKGCRVTASPVLAPPTGADGQSPGDEPKMEQDKPIFIKGLERNETEQTEPET